MDTAEELWEEAHEHLALGELEAALAAAERLATLDLEAGLEVRALALAAAGRPDEALAELDRALERSPEAWRLALLQGNLAGDVGDLDRAHAAYDRARSAAGSCATPVERAAVDYNQALLHEAQGERARALALLEGLAEPEEVELAARLDTLKARVLVGLGLAPRALDLLADRLEDCEGEALAPAALAELLCERGRALHAAGHDTGEVVETLLLAVELEPACHPAADLLREVEGRRSDDCKLYELVLEVREPVLGEEPPRAGLDGHCRSFRVIAPSPAEAEALAARFERSPLARVLDCRELAPMPGEPAGVAEASSAVRFSGS